MLYRMADNISGDSINWTDWQGLREQLQTWFTYPTNEIDEAVEALIENLRTGEPTQAQEDFLDITIHREQD